jgi:hypothetical protein
VSSRSRPPRPSTSDDEAAAKGDPARRAEGEWLEDRRTTDIYTLIAPRYLKLRELRERDRERERERERDGWREGEMEG